MNIEKVIISLCHDPAFNLSFEEYLNDLGKNVLYLWQNEPTVVIGRNQNPYRECNLKALKDDNVHLMRRKSGCGAVFHDLCNLNFTLITEKSPDCVDKNFQFVKDVLSSLNIEAQQSGRNDIIANGKKISGNAFFENEKIFCQHGTLLISADLKRLENYLTVSKLKLESKGIESVKSRVCNLCDIDSSIDVQKVIDAFIKTADCEVQYLNSSDIEKLPTLRDKIERYNSWAWVFSQAPQYNISFEKRFNDGIISAELFIDSGIIKSARISSDSIYFESLEDFSKSLSGEEFKLLNIESKIEKFIKSEKTRENLKELFKSNLTQ